jgi:DNA-binding MarR family transcriptional regulator
VQFAWICLLSIMVDKESERVPIDNIRTLLYYLGLAIDARMSQFRRGTPYENVRPSDVRVFVRASRSAFTISDIARELQITRQAAQSSVQRLLKLQVIALKLLPGNKRDKVVVITPKGELATKTARQQVVNLENEFAEMVGKEKLEELRCTLSIMLEQLNNTLKQQA